MKNWLAMLLKPDEQRAILQKSCHGIALLFQWRSLNHIFRLFIVLVLIINLAGCGGDKAVSQQPSLGIPKKTQLPAQLSGKLAEVAPPSVIQELNRILDVYRPQVKILSPMDDEVLQTDNVTVGLEVKDLPIFKDQKYGLGPHLSIFLDNQLYTGVYDFKQPLKISNLTPGTHTLRVFAEKPWYESFKNDGAYTQAVFHVFTQTDENNPQSSLPLLTYNRPDGDYGTEPILLDFYLTNAPLQVSTNTNQKGSISDWRIRCTINGDKFVLDRWQSIYLKGFQKGKNWVQLEFLDDQGEPIKNVFNTTTRTINYEPKGKDNLSRIIRGELTFEQVRGIVDVTYNPPAPVVEETPTPEPVIKETPTPKETATPEAIIEETKQPEVTPEAVIKETPMPEVTPKPEITPEPPAPGKLGNILNRLQKPKSNITPNPSDVETFESDRIQENRENTNDVDETSDRQTDVTNDVINNDTPAIAPAPKPNKTDFGKYFQRPKPSVAAPTSTITDTNAEDAGVNQGVNHLENQEDKSVSEPSVRESKAANSEDNSTQLEIKPELTVKSDEEKPKFSINDYLQKIKPKTPVTVPGEDLSTEQSEKLRSQTEEKAVDKVVTPVVTPSDSQLNPDRVEDVNQEENQQDNKQPEKKPAINLLEKVKRNRLIQKLQNPDKNDVKYEVKDFIEITPESKPTPDLISPE